VEIQQFRDAASTADLLLPAPSYLEIDGHALANGWGITRFCNPAQSAIINELTRCFYQLDWISPATADIPFWNEEASRLLASLSQRKPQSYREDAVKPEDLRTIPLLPDSLLQRQLINLYNKRKEITSF